MADLINLKDAKGIYNIDIGGTPANVLEKGKLGFLLENGIKPEQILIVVDPFDFSRLERSLTLNDIGTVKKFKFSVPIKENTEKISSEYFDCPTKEQIAQLFGGNKGKILDGIYKKYQIFKPQIKKNIAINYDRLQQNMEGITKLQNLRTFMNSLIEILSPVPVKLKYLESILTENKDRIYELLKQMDIETRIFCSGCGKIIPYTFSISKFEDKICCSTVEDIIKKGNYVPEEGLLPTILYLSGVNPCFKSDSEYCKKMINLLKDLGKFDRPIITYSEKPDRTMFEYYLLKKE